MPSELRAQIEDAQAILSEAGERWLETKAAGRSTATIEAEVKAAEANLARLERQFKPRR